MATFHEEAGKGDYRRKRQVDKEVFDKNWDAIFGKKEVPKEESGCNTVVDEVKDAVEG